MKKDWSPTREAFDRLLAWLDPDRERAGEKYEEIRGKLIRIFARRGCPVAEELADEVIDRVARKYLEIADTYEGEPILYFCGVAHNVFLEYVKRRPEAHHPQPDPPEEKERYSACLDSCIERLDPQKRDLIIEYFRDEKRAKIDHRKQLANRLGITLISLRTRAHRVRMTLQKCLGECLSDSQARH